MANDLERIRRRELKACILDIESTGLKADWGYIVSACVKTINADNLNGETVSFRCDDMKQKTDEKLVRCLVNYLNEFDLIVNWYGSRFDLPFINARAMKHGIMPPAREFRRDLCLSSRGSLALTGHSLANVSRFLFGKTHKTRTDHDIWVGAIRGEKKAIDYLDEHCIIDVLETEKVYKKMVPILGKLRRG